MSGVPDVHEVLRWANRSEVAREITRRGYRVSLETLNRWHRQRKEVPAAVERIVFDMFGISGHSESAPAWAEALQQTVDSIDERLNRALIESDPNEILQLRDALHGPGRSEPPPDSAPR